MLCASPQSLAKTIILDASYTNDLKTKHKAEWKREKHLDGHTWPCRNAFVALQVPEENSETCPQIDECNVHPLPLTRLPRLPPFLFTPNPNFQFLAGISVWIKLGFSCQLLRCDLDHVFLRSKIRIFEFAEGKSILAALKFPSQDYRQHPNVCCTLISTRSFTNNFRLGWPTTSRFEDIAKSGPGFRVWDDSFATQRYGSDLLATAIPRGRSKFACLEKAQKGDAMFGYGAGQTSQDWRVRFRGSWVPKKYLVTLIVLQSIYL